MALLAYEMTKAEFIDRYKRAKACDKCLGTIFLFLVVMGLLLWPWLTDQVNQWGIPWLVDLFKYPWAVFVATLIIFGLLSTWNRRQQGLAAGMICANCGAVLTQCLASIAIATGKCGECGKHVFDETSA